MRTAGIRTWSVTDRTLRRARTGRASGQCQYRVWRVGRRRLSQCQEREADRQGRIGLESPLSPLARQAVLGAAPARQCGALEGSRPHRARLRLAEAPHGTFYPHHRQSPRQGQNRHGQYCRQHEAPCLLREQNGLGVDRARPPGTRPEPARRNPSRNRVTAVRPLTASENPQMRFFKASNIISLPVLDTPEACRCGKSDFFGGSYIWNSGISMQNMQYMPIY